MVYLAKWMVSTRKLQLKTAKGDITTLKSDASGLSAKITNAQGDVNTLKADAKTMKSDISDAKGNISELQRTSTNLQSQITNNNTNINILSRDPMNYSQLKEDTADYFGFTYDNTADGKWYTVKTLSSTSFLISKFQTLFLFWLFAAAGLISLAVSSVF